MKKSNALTEEKLKEVIDSLIKKETITLEEKKILLRIISKGNGSFMKKINDFKIAVLKLQLDNGFDSLSIDMLNLYTEICRQYPTTGPTSIFNKLIKK